MQSLSSIDFINQRTTNYTIIDPLKLLFFFDCFPVLISALVAAQSPLLKENLKN
jgi:hypothetical protein